MFLSHYLKKEKKTELTN